MYLVYEPITDMYRYRPIYWLLADILISFADIENLYQLSVLVIGIGQYECLYR